MPSDTWKNGPKKRSKAQRINSSKLGQEGHAHNSAANKENIGQDSSRHDLEHAEQELDLARSQLENQIKKTYDARRLNTNARRRGTESKSREGKLKEVVEKVEGDLEKAKEENDMLSGVVERMQKEQDVQNIKISRLAKQKRSLQAKATRAKLSNEKALDRISEASQQSNDATITRHLKENGIVTDDTREMIRDLVECNIPVKYVGKAIGIVADHLGLRVEDTFSERTVSRAVLEGGVAATLQVVEEWNMSSSESFRNIQQ
jgi:chromosome segregation ATPase